MTETSIGQGKVSIVIPCYNHGAMLREALDSVEHARNANVVEVIIVDDGSSEPEAARILNEAAEAGYCVVSQPNPGVSAARNAGIRLAKGEFILPLDSDNRLRGTYLQEGVSLLQSNPGIGVIYTDGEYFGERVADGMCRNFDLFSLIMGNFIDACALYRKELWEEVGGYDERMRWMGFEDWDFWLRVAVRGARFVHIPKIGFDYRVRTNSLVAKANQDTIELRAYIFNKPELALYARVRQTDEEVQNLRGGIGAIQASYSYRLGRALLAPARLLRKWWRGFYREMRCFERAQH